MKEKSLQWDAKLYQKHSKLQFNLGMMTIERLRPKDSMRILEIGSGNGMLTVELAKKIPNAEITAIEVSKEMAVQIKKNIKVNNLKNIKLINMDALEIKFNNEFDTVFSNSAIHWISDLELLYKLIYNALKNNGRISIQIGLKERSLLTKTIYKLYKIKRFREHFRKITLPWRFLTIDENIKILKDNKFSNINIEPYRFIHEFKTCESLLGYFKSAAMVPFLNVLPDNLKNEFEEKFLEIYLNENNQKLDITTTRGFISAEKII